jgi:hypothetical protein
MQSKQARPRKGMQAATNINTPRSIRSRLSFPRRKAPAPDSAAVPEAPQQQVVRSASGRTAMGPWIGSFGSAEEPVRCGRPLAGWPASSFRGPGPRGVAISGSALLPPPGRSLRLLTVRSSQPLPHSRPCSPTLFASSQGRVFADLSGGAVASEDLVSNPEVAGAAQAVAVVHRPQPPMVEVERQARMMRAKEEAGRGTYRAPRANNLMRRQRRIGQARKHN